MGDKPLVVSDLASQGGKARAKALTAARRSEIARQAIAARWGRNLPVVTHGSDDHPLQIGNITIPCYVLDGKTRVIVHRGLQRALGMAQSGGAQRMADFVARIESKGIPCKDLVARINNPLGFRPLHRGLAFGYEATVLADLCDIILAARKAKILTAQQEKFAEAAEILVRGFARVGIIALIDEATGFQEDRTRDALAKILEKFVADELKKWVKTFPLDYFKELCRIRNVPFSPTGFKLPQYFGHITNDLIYSRLAPGVLQELQRKNPVDGSGRKAKHHQWLTEDVGHPQLLRLLGSIVTLMKLSNNWQELKEKVDKLHPVYQVLPLFEGMDDEE